MPRKIRTKSERLFVHGEQLCCKSEIALGSVPDFAHLNAQNLANICSCPTGGLHYEPMFVQKEKKSSRVAARAADAIDLMIEFATLGEYGLEYPEPVRSTSRRKSTPHTPMNQAEGNDGPHHHGGGESASTTGHRHGAGPQRHRHGRRPCRPGRTRVDLPGWSERPGHEVPGVQPGRRHKAEVRSITEPRKHQRNRPTSALPEALRPPRIRLEAA